MSPRQSFEQGQLLLSPKQDPSLLYVAPQGKTEADLAVENGAAAVDVISHHIDLQNAITDMSRLSMLRGYIKRDDGDRFNGRTSLSEEKRTNVLGRIKEVATNFNASLSRSLGKGALETVFTFQEMRSAKATPQEMTSDFLKEYYGHEKYKHAQAFRRKLVHTTRVLALDQITRTNRAEKLRPHQAYKEVGGVVSGQEAAKTSAEKQAERVKIARSRMRGIKEDDRAGYYPTTTLEKNQVLTFLDYLDNPEFPLRVNNQFIEVYNKTQSYVRDQKIRGEQDISDPERGPISITYELIDYLKDAMTQREALEQIEGLIHEMPNRRVTLFDEQKVTDLRLDQPGFAALVRYRDLVKFVRDGVDAMPHRGANNYGVMKLVTKRFTKNGVGIHKHVGDRYTSEYSDIDDAKRIKEKIASMTVGEARDLIGPAIVDQIRRESFMRTILEDIAYPVETSDARTPRALNGARDVARQVFDEIQAA